MANKQWCHEALNFLVASTEDKLEEENPQPFFIGLNANSVKQAL